jgi:hypothetical protein
VAASVNPLLHPWGVPGEVACLSLRNVAAETGRENLRDRQLQEHKDVCVRVCRCMCVRVRACVCVCVYIYIYTYRQLQGNNDDMKISAPFNFQHIASGAAAAVSAAAAAAAAVGDVAWVGAGDDEGAEARGEFQGSHYKKIETKVIRIYCKSVGDAFRP